MKHKSNHIIPFIIIPIMFLPGCNAIDWLRTRFGMSQPPKIPNTYNGTPITADTVYALAYSHSPMPLHEHVILNQWLEQPKNKLLLEQLLQFQFDSPQQFYVKSEQDNQHIQRAGLCNKSRSNYVFRVPGLNYYIKIAGPTNRAQSALMELGVWPGQLPTQKQFDYVLSGSIPTYQTTSRAAYYLVLKKLKEEKDLDRIAIPNTHLMYYPGEQSNPNDDMVFILEKALPDETQKITIKQMQELPRETLEDLLEAIIGVGLWSLKDNIFMDTKGQMLYLVDLEQPNNSASKDFFLKDEARYYGNIVAGIKELLEMIKESPEKIQFVRNFVASHPVIQSPYYNKRYKKELMQLLKQKVSR